LPSRTASAINSRVFLSNFEKTNTTFTDGYFAAFCGVPGTEANTPPGLTLPISFSAVRPSTVSAIPFDQVNVHLGDLAEARELASPHGTLKRADKNLHERKSTQAFTKSARVAFAAGSQRQVGQTRVLP